MRRFLQTLVVLSVTPVGLVLPVVSRPAPGARPVTPVVTEHAVSGVDATAARGLPGWGAAGPARARPVALTRPAQARRFAALGVTWAAGTGDEVEVLARVRQDGRWTAWHELDTDSDHGPDDRGADTATGRVRAGSAPWFTGPADGYQVRVGVVEGRAPRDLRVSLVDPGSSPADASVGAAPTLGDDTAAASVGMPAYVTRAQWGADERLRSGTPDYSGTIKVGFVHHTDTSNSYTRSQAAAMVRSVYAFHTRSRGWSDVGYNFLADKYGRIFEGRYGGVSRPVIGAHTGGFNTDTFGVALLGDYTSVAPSSAQLGALQQLFAWKLGLHFANPLGRTALTSRGGGRFASGTQVTFANVSGHRDAGYTACPGYQTYRRLPTIRSAIKTLMGGSLYYPSVSATRALYLTTPHVTVRATTPMKQAWRLDVRNRAGVIVRQVTGPQTTSIAASWDLTDAAGRLVIPDRYTLTLESWTWRTKALPYRVTVNVASPLPSGVAISHTGGRVHLFVDNGAISGLSPALAAAVRPTPAIASYPGQRAELPIAAAPIRDGLYVRSAESGATYVVAEGHRRPVSAAVASALGLSEPLAVPAAVVATMPGAPAWTDTTRHPDGFVVQDDEGTSWRLESGVRRPFTSPAALDRWAVGLAVPAASPGDLALPVGAPLAPPEGTLLRTATGAGVVSGGAFRPLSDPAPLGYDVTSAPLATSDDLAALPSGEPVGTDRHPSGTLLRTGTTYYEVLGDSRRRVPAALLAADPREAVAPLAGELSALTYTRWTPPSGLAGRAADGTVRVVEAGRLVTLTNAGERALGYHHADLPALEAADFGPLPVGVALANAAAHPAGTLVTDGAATWLVDAGARRPVAPSLVRTWLGRPPVEATPADLALPVGRVAPPATGAWVETPDGTRWLVDRGARRLVSEAVAVRLGLDGVSPQPVVAEELAAVTTLGSAVR